MTTATSSSTRVCPKCKGLCRTVEDLDGDYDKCINCGWTSDSQETPAQEPVLEEAAGASDWPICTGPECDRYTRSRAIDLCATHDVQKQEGRPLTPIGSTQGRIRGSRTVKTQPEAMPEAQAEPATPSPGPRVAEEAPSASPELTIEGLMERLRSRLQRLEDNWHAVKVAIVAIEQEIKEANA